MEGQDILREIPDEDLEKLRDLYEGHQDWAPHVYSMFNTCIRWKKTEPGKNYLTFYRIGDDYLKTGTFVLHQQYSCYDIFIFTLEESQENLRKALSETKKFDWTKNTLFYAVLSRFLQTVRDVLKVHEVDFTEGRTGLFRISKEKASRFEIILPDDVYLGKITAANVAQINEAWPHRYEGSQGYLGTFVKMNGGFGIFLKENDELVAWVLKNYLGQIGILQTGDGYKRRGYATILIKAMAREIAEEGHNAIGTVLEGNAASETLFSKLGFENIDACIFLEGRVRS